MRNDTYNYQADAQGNQSVFLDGVTNSTRIDIDLFKLTRNSLKEHEVNKGDILIIDFDLRLIVDANYLIIKNKGLLNKISINIGSFINTTCKLRSDIKNTVLTVKIEENKLCTIFECNIGDELLQLQLESSPIQNIDKYQKDGVLLS